MLKRLGVVVGLSAAVLVASALPASADDGYGFTDCTQYPNPGCELGAGKNPQPGNGHQGNGNSKPGNPGNNNPGTGQADANGDTIVGGNTNLAKCGYERSSYQGPPPGTAQPAAFHVPPKSGEITAVPAVYRLQSEPATAQFAVTQPRFAQAQPPSGAWYVYKCTGPGFRDALYRPPVWIADGQQPEAAQLPSPAELAQMARKQLRLPSPTIAANPVGDQLVNLPTWMWLSGGWGPVSATASVPGVSVTATATPTSVTWSMGDGSTVTCTGAGTPFRAGSDPKAPSPDCGHTYRTSSAKQAGQAFPVAATVHWTVTWAGAGQGGTFPDLTTTGNAAFRVAEAQALNNGGG